MKKSNPYSHLTAKKRDRISMPARILLSENLLKGKILDFGCGLGNDVEVLKSKGFDVQGYDPHYNPNLPLNKFDTIYCFYVLNVLLPEEQIEVLINISRYLLPHGRAYFSVRRDIFREGFRNHFKHNKPVYQCNVTLPYKSIFLNKNSEIYQYQHFNKIQSNKKNKCIFCSPNSEWELLAETINWYVIMEDRKALIIPKDHVQSYFDMNFDLQKEGWQVAKRVKKILQNRFKISRFKIEVEELEEKENGHFVIKILSK